MTRNSKENASLLSFDDSDELFLSNENYLSKIFNSVDAISNYISTDSNYHLELVINSFSRIVEKMFKLVQNDKHKNIGFEDAVLGIIEIKNAIFYRLYYENGNISKIDEDTQKRFNAIIASFEEKNNSFIQSMLKSFERIGEEFNIQKLKDEIKLYVIPEEYEKVASEIDNYDLDDLYRLAQMVIMLNSYVPFKTIRESLDGDRECAYTWNDFAQEGYNPITPISRIVKGWFCSWKNGPEFYDYYMRCLENDYFSYLLGNDNKRRAYILDEKRNIQSSIDSRTKHIDQHLGIASLLLGKRDNNMVMIISDIDYKTFKNVRSCGETVIEQFGSFDRNHETSKSASEKYETAISLCNIKGNIPFELSKKSGRINIKIHIPERISDYQSDMLYDIREILKITRQQMRCKMSIVGFSSKRQLIQEKPEDIELFDETGKITIEGVLEEIDTQIKSKEEEENQTPKKNNYTFNDLNSNVEVLDGVIKTITSALLKKNKLKGKKRK